MKSARVRYLTQYLDAGGRYLSKVDAGAGLGSSITLPQNAARETEEDGLTQRDCKGKVRTRHVYIARLM